MEVGLFDGLSMAFHTFMRPPRLLNSYENIRNMILVIVQNTLTAWVASRMCARPYSNIVLHVNYENGFNLGERG